VSHLTLVEKKFVFDFFSRAGNIPKETFVQEVVILVNKFLEYSFSSDGWDHDSRLQIVENLGKITHYWDFIAKELAELKSVTVQSFFDEESKTSREKALSWILLALNDLDELDQAFKIIFEHPYIVQLYSKKDSFIINNRREILASIESLRSVDLYID
jgi:hypothetical protein